MKKFLHSFSLLLGMLGLLAGPVAQAQTQSSTATWQAALALGSTSATAVVQASATDAAGMVYVAGYFNGTVVFGNTTLTSSIGSDTFVAKWSPATHSFVWGFKVGSGYDSNITALAVDNGTVYVAGSFGNTSIVINGTTIPNVPRQQDVSLVCYQSFMVALADAGTSASYRWVMGVQGSYYTWVTALAAQGGAVYIGGSFWGNTTQVGTTTLSAPNTSTGGWPQSGLVAKLTGATTTTPAVAWTKVLPGNPAAYVDCLAVVGSTIYLAGELYGSIQLGSTTLDTTTGGYPDAVVVAKLTDTGTTATYVWATLAARMSDMRTLAMAAQGNDLFLAGSWRGAALTVGPTTLPNPYPNATATGGRLSDIYVTKLTDAGTTPTYVWTKLAGGEGVNSVLGLVVKGPAVYVAGEFDSDHLTWGSTVLTNYNPVSNYDSPGPLNTDWYVARLTDNGPTAAITWAQKAGGLSTDRFTALAVSGTEIYTAGYIMSTANFGALAVANTTGYSTLGVSAYLTESASLSSLAATSLPKAVIYPNPAHAAATVHLPAVVGSGLATLTLLDALGRTVCVRQAALGVDYPFDLDGLAPGVYALRLQAGAAAATQKLVIE